MNNYKEDRNNKLFELALKKLNLRFPVAEIAKKINVSKGNVSNYLNNKKPVSDNFIKSLCDEFQLNYEDLLNEIRSSKSNNFKQLYLESGIEEKFKEISDNDYALYLKHNKKRLLANDLFYSIIKKEAWEIINNELSIETLRLKEK